ncbi:MAG: hypothetical protein ABJO09_13610 [Hyphomicrobiales bacterium]
MNTATRQFPLLVFLFFVFLAITAFTLGGCGHVPVSSMYKLSKVDIETTDVEKLQVAVQIPNAVKVRDEGVTMTMSLRRTDKLPKLYERFKLEQTSSNTTNTVLAKHRKADQKILVYRIARTDIKRLNRFRKIQAGAGDEGKRKGQMTVTTAVCRKVDLKRGEIKLSTFLRTSETKEFVPLVLDVNLGEAYPKDEFTKQFPMCD